MKKMIVVALFGLAAIVQLACDEPVTNAYVEGEFEFSAQPPDYSFQPTGSLAQSGATYYGYCKYSADTQKFEFEVGDVAKASVDSASQTYVKFTGIAGPPADAAYLDAGNKIIDNEDPAKRTSFAKGYVSNGGNDFVFDQPEPPGNESCYVTLFAKAAQGEVTSVEEKPFTYYVELFCTGLDDVMSGDQELVSFNGFFFFQGC